MSLEETMDQERIRMAAGVFARILPGESVTIDWERSACVCEHGVSMTLEFLEDSFFHPWLIEIHDLSKLWQR